MPHPQSMFPFVPVQLILSLLILCFGSTTIHAQDIAVGVNVVSPLRASEAQQDAILGELKAAGVHAIRTGITPDEAGVDFVQRAYANGIAILLILDFRYPPDAPTRPYRPKEFPEMWSGHPLSSADPALSKAYFESLLGKLDTKGIKLAGLELGNEINGGAFNPEFPLPGEGKNFGLDDLYHDPEGQQIARGYLQYLKVLSELKNVRDHSKLNRDTPIISAGLVAWGFDQPPPGPGKDVVSLSATLDYLRANGLDNLVDAYGIHTYPWANGPGDKNAAAGRLYRLKKYDLAQCRPLGAVTGKPCWITEWGFANNDISCPPDKSARTSLVREMMGDFAQAARERRLSGLFYFAWNSDPWAKETDPFSVYRCGRLTESGKLALSPLSTE